jgi:hypothetical protein
MNDFARGNGVAFIAVSSEGSAVVVLDEGYHVDIYLFVYFFERTDAFVKTEEGPLKGEDIAA